VEDIATKKKGIGMQIRLRKSKTDQHGDGRWINLSERTKLAVEEWLNNQKLVQGFCLEALQNMTLQLKTLKVLKLAVFIRS